MILASFKASFWFALTAATILVLGATYNLWLIKRVIFGTDADPAPSVPSLDDDQAGLLLEVMKDLLYQSYVRKGRLQQAMVVRRFFSEEAGRSARSVEHPSNSLESSRIEG